MKPGPHIVASSVAGGAVWAATGNPVALPVAIAAGVLPDLDHLLDYYFRYIKRDGRFLFYFLHTWEYVLLGLVAWIFWLREDWLIAAVAGYFTQVGGDQVFNHVRWHTYLITSRAARGFRSASVARPAKKPAYDAVVASVPFGKDRLRRWFEQHQPRK